MTNATLCACGQPLTAYEKKQCPACINVSQSRWKRMIAKVATAGLTLFALLRFAKPILLLIRKLIFKV